MKEDSIRVENFNYVCSGRQLLRDINFSIRQGGWLSLIGPNGAGKSTMLRSMLGLAKRCTSRGIYLFGHEVRNLSRRQIALYAAYVPQMPAIPPFSVKEFLSLSGYARGCGAQDREKDISAAMDQTNIVEYAQKPMRILSGGILRKVFIAGALAQGSEILLLDEPYSYLDPPQAMEMNNLLGRFNRDTGKTIVMATHDLNLAMASGGLGLLLRKGEQLAFGPIADFPGSGALDRAFEHKFHYFRNPGDGRLLIQP